MLDVFTLDSPTGAKTHLLNRYKTLGLTQEKLNNQATLVALFNIICAQSTCIDTLNAIFLLGNIAFRYAPVPFIDQCMHSTESRKVPLIEAIKHRNHKSIHFLLCKNPNLLIRDEKGNTPLHWAVIRKIPSLISNLLERGAPCFLANNQGLTPLDIAAQRNDLDILSILISDEDVNDTLPHCSSSSPSSSSLVDDDFRKRSAPTDEPFLEAFSCFSFGDSSSSSVADDENTPTSPPPEQNGKNSKRARR